MTVNDGHSRTRGEDEREREREKERERERERERDRVHYVMCVVCASLVSVQGEREREREVCCGFDFEARHISSISRTTACFTGCATKKAGYEIVVRGIKLRLLAG